MKSKQLNENESFSISIKNSNMKNTLTGQKNSEGSKSPISPKNPILKIHKELLNSKYTKKYQISDFCFLK